MKSSNSEESTTGESSASGESTTAEESSSDIFEESSFSPSSPATSSTAPTPTANPTYYGVVRGPLTPEEEVQPQVLFSDRTGASAFANYVVSYAS